MNTLKHELLNQNGNAAVDEEALLLNRILESERRRVRWLAAWTIAVWLAWILMISLSLVVPMVLAHTNVPSKNAQTQPVQAVQPREVLQPASSRTVTAGIVVGTLLVAAFIGLPILGIVLAIMLIVACRSASLNQVRASIAAIDAQLRLLGATGIPPKPGP